MELSKTLRHAVCAVLAVALLTGGAAAAVSFEAQKADKAQTHHGTKTRKAGKVATAGQATRVSRTGGVKPTKSPRPPKGGGSPTVAATTAAPTEPAAPTTTVTSAPTSATPTTAAPTSPTAGPSTTTSTPTSVPTSPTSSPTALPSGNPAQICGSSVLDGGPATAPAGAVTVPAGSNSGIDFGRSNTTYWFAPGTHTLGSGQYSQIIPGNGATYVGAPGAVLDGQGLNSYAFTQHATDVTIRYLTIRGFKAPNNEGVVNHDSGVRWLMEYLTINNNSGAGVMLGSGNTLRWSCLKDNGQYGFSSYSPLKGALQGIVLDHNEISGNNRDDWESKIAGCGCTGGGKFWDAHNVRITNNWVHDNLSVGIWADQNNYDFVISGNWIEDNWSHGIFYETSYNAVITDNVLRRNAIRVGQSFQARGDTFPIGSIYISESGYDPRVPAPPGATSFLIARNLFEDNWGGVVLWENADRFCGSPANTSTGYCTLVNPGVANLLTCDAETFGALKPEPFYSDCRWATKNVAVAGNTFRLDPVKVPNCQVGFCGLQAVVSNFGTYPSWSPYDGRAVQDAITFGQGNRWAGNIYVGPWRFNPYETGRILTLAQWLAAPYSQDGS
jgi:hypothetical protein